MIRARDVAAQRHQRLEPFDLRIDRRVVVGEDLLVHAAHAPQLPAVLRPPRRDAGMPRADLDGEHGVDAVFEPDRQQLVDHAVAVQRHDADAVVVQQPRDAPVVRADQPGEQPRVDQRAVLEADVLPEMPVVEGDPRRQRRGGALIAQLGHRLDYLLQQRRVIRSQVTQTDDAQPVADDAEQAAAPQAAREGWLLGEEVLPSAPAKAQRPARAVDALAIQPPLAVAQARPEDALPLGAALQQVINLRGNRDDVILLQHDGAGVIQHVPRAVGEAGDDAAAETRLQPHVRAKNAAPAEVEAQALAEGAVDGVVVVPACGLGFGDVSLGRPLLQRLGPIAEVYYGQAVGGLVVQDRQGAFTVVHGVFSSTPKQRQ